MPGESQSDAEEIVRELRGSTDERWQALETLASVRQPSESLATIVADPLVEAVLGESNTYYRMRGWAAIERLDASHPGVFESHVADIVATVATTLEGLDSEDGTDDSTEISVGTDVVRTIVEETLATNRVFDVELDHLDTLRLKGNLQHRALAYRLYGRSRSMEGIDRLHRGVSREPPNIREAAKAGIQDACQVMIASLEGNGPATRSPAARGLTELVENTDGDQIESVVEVNSFARRLVSALDDDIADPVSTLLVRFCRSDPGLTQIVVEDLVEDRTHESLGAASPVLLDLFTTFSGIWEPVVSLFPPEIVETATVSWPESLEAREKRLVAGLVESESPAIAANCLRDRLRESPVGPVLLATVRASTDTATARRVADVVSKLPPSKEIESDWVDTVATSVVDLATDETIADRPTTKILEEIRRRDSEVAERIDRMCVAQIERRSPGPDDVRWDLVEHATKTNHGASLSVVERLVPTSDDRSPERIRSVLDLIAAGATHSVTVPDTLQRFVLAQLSTEHRRVQLSAIDAAEAIGFLPPPESLTAMGEDEDDTIRDRVNRAVDAMSDRRVHGWDPKRTLEADDTETAVFEGESGDLRLKYRGPDEPWHDIETLGLRQSMLDSVLDRVMHGEDTPVVLPYFDPREIVLVTAALAIENASTDPQIALFSPGSSVHWGTKGDIREELDRYGIARRSGDVSAAPQLPSIVPHAYVSGQEVKEHSDGEGPGRIILTKDLTELSRIEDLDVVVTNLVSRTNQEFGDQIDKIADRHGSATFVNVYSYQAKNEGDGRPRYGPPPGLEDTDTVPGAQSIDQILSTSLTDGAGTDSVYWGDSRTDRSDPVQRRVDDVQRLTEASSIRVEHVATSTLQKLFDRVFEMSASLRDVRDERAGTLIFSRQMFFERLPVPVSDYDEWVRDRYLSGDRFVPPLVDERIQDLEHKGETVSNLEAVKPVNEAAQILHRVADELSEKNPLFDRLRDRIDTAREEDKRIAIFTDGTKRAMILRSALTNRDVVDEAELGGDLVTVCHPDDARDLERHDKLYVVGPLYPENAGFYVHPRIEETVVLTYDRTWARMIERHATEFVDQLNAVVGEAGYEPYAEPRVCGDTEPEGPDEATLEGDETRTPPEIPDETPGSTRTQSPTSGFEDGSKVDILADAMASTSRREYEDESGRYQREIRNFELITDDGEARAIDTTDTFLRKRKSDADETHHWVTPEGLREGDTIAIVPDEVESEMWQSHLQSVWSDQLDVDIAARWLRQWYETLQDIWHEVSRKVGAADLSDDETQLTLTDVPSDDDIYDAIYRRLNERNEQFSRVEATVHNWFESVRTADRSLDLPEQPSLVIGPRSADDIAAIGRAFDEDELTNNAADIRAAMEGFRTVNRKEGIEYRQKILDQINDSDPTPVSKAAEYYEVVEITETTDQTSSDSEDSET